MKKILFISVLILASISVLIFVSGNYNEKKSDKIQIVTTIFPLYDFAKNIGGEKADVSLLLSPGLEAHSFEPKPSDISKIYNSDIFVYTGEFMEVWAKDIISGLNNENVKIVDSSSGIVFLEEDVHDEHTNHSVDPHIWLDFDNAKIMAKNIANELENVDPENADYYKENLDRLVKELSDIDNKYKERLTDCESRDLIYGGHFAFGYLAKRYGLEYLSAQGFSPDAEPSAQDLIYLVQEIKNKNVKYIFYEELSSPKIAETLANEADVKMLLLNAAHNLGKDDFEKGVSFLNIMEDNLNNLEIGLNCRHE